ncbi:hypothetical protein BSKO_11921 [Bryopsis sp. KO-2023]|nr:hypothetical protein BSKO_11921 [Bryopsis sp. KO-2023]
MATLSAARDNLRWSSPTRAQPSSIQTSGSKPTADDRDAQDTGGDRVGKSGNSTPPVLAFILATPEDIPYSPMEEAYRMQDDMVVHDFGDMDNMMDKSQSFGKSLCRNSIVVAFGSIAIVIFVLYPIVLCFLVCFARKIARTYREEHDELHQCSLA